MRRVGFDGDPAALLVSFAAALEADVLSDCDLDPGQSVGVERLLGPWWRRSLLGLAALALFWVNANVASDPTGRTWDS